MQFVSTAELARRTGVSRITAWRTCVRHPGFALRVGGTFRIPEVHVQRVERGEFPAAIAAEAQLNGSSSANLPRDTRGDARATLGQEHSG